MSVYTPKEKKQNKVRLEMSDCSKYQYKPRPPDDKDIIITGISCRLPESDNMEEFRLHLLRGEDMVTENDRRWEPGYSSLPSHSGTIRDLTKFDATFFGVPPKVAEVMDPQLRIMLELTEEALVDAGMTASALRGSRTGVFIGCGTSEAYEGFSTDPEHVKGYAPLGCTASMFANRISYAFDLKGPSYALRNGDGSSLLALDRAVWSMKNGNCEAAVVGGCNLCLKPATSLQALDMDLLSPDGLCRCYDEDASGVCRSEGIVILFLQRRKAAKRIHARVLHSKAMTFHTGLYPSYLSQRSFLQEVYREAGISPAHVGYVETSSSCTADGDMEELRALTDVFCDNRDNKTPLLIGSVKSNIGHTEGASGVASLAKIVVAFHDEMVPANLHYSTPNSRVPGLRDGRLQVITERKHLTNQPVGVSSYGSGGTNVHVILDAGSQNEAGGHVTNQKEARGLVTENFEKRLFTYCGRTKEAVECVLMFMENNARDYSLHALLNETANRSPSSFPYRGYTLLHSVDTVMETQRCQSTRRPVWYVFSGMGSQWPGMARKMMNIGKFRESLMDCGRILKPHGVDLYDIIMEGDEHVYDKVLHSFVGITSIQVALVDLLTSLGIQPDGIVGHSVGELGCGYADGSLTAEETVLAAYWRGRCIQDAELPPGGMAAVGLTWEEAKRQCPAGVVPACHNSEKTVTISGPRDSVARFVQELKDRQVFAREVNSAGVAFHSPYMKEVAPSFLKELKKLIKSKKRSSRWISSSIPEADWSSELAQCSSAEYHANNFQSPVLFQEALRHIPDGAVVIEIAPHCLLQAVLKRSLGVNCSFIGLMKRGDPDNTNFFYSSVGKCYLHGVKMNPLGLLRPPSFPVPRGTPLCSALVRWDHTQKWPLSDLGDFLSGGSGKQTDSQFEVDISPDSKDHYLNGHCIDGRVLFPACGYMVLAWRALANLRGELYTRMPVVFEDIRIHKATVMPSSGPVKFEVSVVKVTGEFEICEGGSLVASGTVCCPSEPLMTFYDDTESIKTPISPCRMSAIPLSTSDVYKEFRLRGYEYGPTFQGILKAENRGERGELLWADQWISFLDTMMQMNLLTLPGKGLLLPVGVRRLTINPVVHMNKILPLDKGKMGLVVSVDRYAATTVSGGVEMQGLEVRHAPGRVNTSVPVVEKCVFVPHKEWRAETVPLSDYAKCCAGITRQLIKYLTNVDGVPNQKLFRDYMCAFPITGKEESLTCLKQCSSSQNSGLLSLLRKLLSVSRSQNFLDVYGNILSAYRDELQKDKLLSNYLQPQSLKTCLDLVAENSDSRIIRVLEVEASESKMSYEVTKYLDCQPSVEVEYTVADREEAIQKNIDHTDLEKKGMDVIKWTPNQEPEQLEECDLVVANNVLHNQVNLSVCLKNIAMTLKPDGFLLVIEATRNHVICLAFEGLENKVPLCEDSGKRSMSCYCDEEQWVKLFTDAGFEVISQKSDGSFNTTFLLKKKTEIEISKQTVLSINGSYSEWFEKVKEKMLQIQEKPRGHNLWLIADQREPTGILGLVNCLRKEAGGERVRCIFNMDSDKEKLQSPVIDRIMKKDLVMNVQQNGLMGSLRHLPKLESVPCENVYLTCRVPGDLSSLTWMCCESTDVPDHAIPVEVYYTALNIQDKVIVESTAHGPLKLEHPGQEFSGIDSNGRKVMGLVPKGKALSPKVQVEKLHLWEVPDNWTLKQACTVPWAYSVAYYSLIMRGEVQKDQSLLIHGGSSDLGIAAINVAMTTGCRVYTTVESFKSSTYLQACCEKLKKSHIFVAEKGVVLHEVLRNMQGKGM